MFLIDKTSFLMGSIHFAPNGFTLPEEVHQMFERAAKLVLELDPFSGAARQADVMATATNLAPQTPEMKARALRLLDTPAGVTLIDLMGKYGIKKEMLYEKPPIHAMMVIQAKMMRKLGMSPYNGVEFQLIREAKEQDKPIVSLEDERDQLDPMANYIHEVSEEQMRKNLEIQVKGIQQAEEITEMLPRLVLDCQYERLYDLVVDTSGEDVTKTFNPRNRPMAERLSALVKEGPVFCTVGAAHLGGPEAIQRHLGELGHKIDWLHLSRNHEAC